MPLCDPLSPVVQRNRLFWSQALVIVAAQRLLIWEKAHSTHFPSEKSRANSSDPFVLTLRYPLVSDVLSGAISCTMWDLEL